MSPVITIIKKRKPEVAANNVTIPSVVGPHIMGYSGTWSGFQWGYKGELTSLLNHFVTWWMQPYIRSFHPKALLYNREYSPNTKHLYSPSNAVRNPISCSRVWATIRCAGWEVGVGLVRVIMTFLWMSDPPLYFLIPLLKAVLTLLLIIVSYPRSERLLV